MPGCVAHSGTQQQFVNPLGLDTVQAPFGCLPAVFTYGETMAIPEWNRRHICTPAPVTDREVSVLHCPHPVTYDCYPYVMNTGMSGN
jgi:hypothetical protein